jgi:PAS domain S-box-containing protein
MSAPGANSNNQLPPAAQPPTFDVSEAFLDALPGQIAMLDRAGNVRFVNRAWQDFTPTDTFAGADFGVGCDYPGLCIAAGSAESLSIARGIQAVLAGTTPQFTHEYACRISNEERCFRLTATVLGDNSVQGVVIMHLDITSSFARDIAEQKRVAESLREREEPFRQLAENIPVVFWLARRADDAVLYVSPAYERIWGRPCEDLYANPYVYLEAVHIDDRERAWRMFARNNDDGYDVEYRIIRPNGSIAWIHDHGFPIRSKDGQIYHVAGIATDITERKRLEAALLQSQKMEGIGRLAGGIAHDFNNLLTAIVGYAEFAQAALSPEDPISADIEQILRAAHRAAELTRQLLAFARKQLIEPRVINLNDLVLGMDKMLRRIIGEDIELATLPAPDLGLVKVDPGQFEQILINLAINARDAMPHGGRLTIETHNALLDAEYTRQYPEVIPGPHVLLAISDTGIGMSEATRAHIFEPFFTTKELGKGTGLGLATCYGIVKQAGGYIWISSEPERGATFRIYLPRVEAEAAPSKEQVAITSPSGGNETILLVEDEPLVRDLAMQALRANGYTVLVASSGDAALMLAHAYPGKIDLLVADVVMPQMSGPQVAEQLSAARPDVKILYVSGYTEDTTVHGDVLQQGVAFLAKPFTPGALAHSVRDVLDSAT